MIHHETGVLILGAGLQGTGIALELAGRGVPVMLVDQDPRPLNRASLRNEGKIHLGFIWANDRSRATGFQQLAGALSFRRIVDGWVDRSGDWLAVSTPFHYLVAHDSVLTPDALADHYTAIEKRCLEAFDEDPSVDYLGQRPSRLVRRLSTGEIATCFNASRFAAGFATTELAIDLNRLAGCLRAKVDADRNVSFLGCHVVRSVVEDGDGFRVEGDGPEGAWSVRAQQVVNATWERRVAFDRQLGIPAPDDLLHRLKFRVIVRLPTPLQAAPSATMVLGRYGDVVIRPDGSAFLSWYPAGLRGWSHDIQPPADWDAVCRGEVDPDVARDLSASIIAGIADWLPGIVDSEPILVDAGAIVAIGRTDVDDPSSALHDRSHIGVQSRGGYHSVDPGKLTTAPLFAAEAADRIEAFQCGRSVGA